VGDIPIAIQSSYTVVCCVATVSAACCQVSADPWCYLISWAFTSSRAGRPRGAIMPLPCLVLAMHESRGSAVLVCCSLQYIISCTCIQQQACLLLSQVFYLPGGTGRYMLVPVNTTTCKHTCPASRPPELTICMHHGLWTAAGRLLR
jgi:hypothetical protein